MGHCDSLIINSYSPAGDYSEIKALTIYFNLITGVKYGLELIVNNILLHVSYVLLKVNSNKQNVVNMSVRGKNFTASLITFLLILGFYLIRLFQIFQSGNYNLTSVIRLWGFIIAFAVVGTIFVMILTHILSAITHAIEQVNRIRKSTMFKLGKTSLVSSRRSLSIFHPWFFIIGGSKMGKSLIRNNIRKLRFFNGETIQQELAEKVGVTQQTIIAKEQEKYSPSLELAFHIVLAFGLLLNDVFSYDAEGETDKYSKNLTTQSLI